MSFSAIGFVTCFALVMSPSFAQTQGGCWTGSASGGSLLRQEYRNGIDTANALGAVPGKQLLPPVVTGGAQYL